MPLVFGEGVLGARVSSGSVFAARMFHAILGNSSGLRQEFSEARKFVFHFIAFHTLTFHFTTRMCNEMKRNGGYTHQWVQRLADNPLAAFVRGRTKYAFLIIRQGSTVRTAIRQYCMARKCVDSVAAAGGEIWRRNE